MSEVRAIDDVGALSVDMLPLNSLVSLRFGNVEYPSRIEGLQTDAIVVAAPPVADVGPRAPGDGDVEVSWVSPRGRFEQRCELVLDMSSRPRLWQLRPLGRAVLIQRRRFVRVRAAVAVLLSFPGVVVPGTSIDICEGGFRVRIPRRSIDEMANTVLRATMCDELLEIEGHVIRTCVTEMGQTELVVAFEANPRESAIIRRFVLERQQRTPVGTHA